MEDMNRNEIEITTYDRLLRAWENSMELVRDYEMYSKRIEDQKIKEIFKRYARMRGGMRRNSGNFYSNIKTKTKVLYHENESNRLKIKEK